MNALLSTGIISFVINYLVLKGIIVQREVSGVPDTLKIMMVDAPSIGKLGIT